MSPFRDIDTLSWHRLCLALLRAPSSRSSLNVAREDAEHYSKYEEDLNSGITLRWRDSSNCLTVIEFYSLERPARPDPGRMGHGFTNTGVLNCYSKDHFKLQFPDSVVEQQEGRQRTGADEYNRFATSEIIGICTLDISNSQKL